LEKVLVLKESEEGQPKRDQKRGSRRISFPPSYEEKRKVLRWERFKRSIERSASQGKKGRGSKRER